MKKLSPLMLEALVIVTKNGHSYLDRYRVSTIKGLETRGYIEMSKEDDKGYVLSLGGFAYLKANNYAIFTSDIFESADLIHVQIVPISRLDHVRIVREYYVNAALKSEESSFNVLELTADELNNVGRRTNIKGNGDTETRCWEIIASVNYKKNPVNSRLYLVKYVGTDWGYYYGGGRGPLGGIFIAEISSLTNLY